MNSKVVLWVVLLCVVWGLTSRCGAPVGPEGATDAAESGRERKVIAEAVPDTSESVAPEPTPEPVADVSCPQGRLACEGACIDPNTDNGNCGACGNACGAGQTCQRGKCQCGAGTTSCGGKCVNTNTDSLHCGGCNKACASGATCQSGACQCASGATSCSGQCVNTDSDPAHCGGCGKVCPSGTSCVSGQCKCPSGQTLCGSTCVDTSSNAAHCGACNSACPSGQSCQNSACQSSCGATVSFSTQIQPIFNNKCTGCHGGPRPAGGLVLESSKSYAALVNKSSSCSGRLYVKPGAVADSYLYSKIGGGGSVCGNVMPAGPGSLSAADQDTIKRWICHGAPNN